MRKYNLWVISNNGDELIAENLPMQICIDKIRKHPKYNDLAESQISGFDSVIYRLRYLKNIIITTDDSLLEGFRIDIAEEK